MSHTSLEPPSFFPVVAQTCTSSLHSQFAFSLCMGGPEAHSLALNLHFPRHAHTLCQCARYATITLFPFSSPSPLSHLSDPCTHYVCQHIQRLHTAPLLRMNAHAVSSACADGGGATVSEVQVLQRRGLHWRQLELSRTLNDYNVST